MRIHPLFVFSTYLCVALAVLCLGYVAQDDMKSIAPFYAVIGLLIVAAYLSEDRWKLSDTMANVLSLPMFGGWLLWVWSDRTGNTPVEEWQDYLRMLIPYGPPLLAVLTLAKLLRRKRAGDYWGLHILALFQMVMACCLAYINRLDRDDALFGFLLGAYVLTAIWSLHLFYLQRESAASEGASYPRSYVVSAAKARAGKAPGTSRTSRMALVPWRLLGLPASLIWFAVTALFSVTVFLSFSQANPEGAASLMIPGQAKAQVGFNTSMDLNQNAPLKVTDALVMRVQAFDAQGNPVYLGTEQRWRGITCGRYQAGKWTPLPGGDARHLEEGEPLRPVGKQVLLNYYVNLAELGSGGRVTGLEDLPRGVTGPRPLFLADPIYAIRPRSGDRPRWRGDAALPLVALVNPPEWARHSLLFRTSEPVLTLRFGRLTGTLRYQQIHLLPQDASPDANRDADVDGGYVKSLQLKPVAARGWDRLAAQAEEILSQAGVPNGAHLRSRWERGELTAVEERQLRERQAHALEHYLAANPAYSYSLERRDVDSETDPTVDFLCNGKQGHCQLFASALALMLRSQDIPTRVVIGFRGNDWLTAGEIHEVRQYHAHAWVEALIESEDQTGMERRRGRWLTLDPTPGGGTASVYHESSEAQGSGFEEELHFARFLWEALILDYTGDVRPNRFLARLVPDFSWLRWDSIRNNGLPAPAWAALLAIVVTVLGLLLAPRWFRRRRATAQSRAMLVPFYARWLQLMRRLHLHPAAAQTPAEFAALASRRLAQVPGTASLTPMPASLVKLFYAIRFGGRTPAPAELAGIERELDQLERAL